MKKFKHLFVIVIAIIVSVSCSNDNDDNDTHPLVGSWGLTVSDDGYELNMTVIFNANLTGSSVVIVDILNEEQEIQNDSFNWSADGDKLTMIIDGATEISTYSILGDKLTVTIEDVATVLIRQ